MRRDSPAQLGKAQHRRILVPTVDDRGCGVLANVSRSRIVGKALAKIDGPVLLRQARHAFKDAGSEMGEDGIHGRITSIANRAGVWRMRMNEQPAAGVNTSLSPPPGHADERSLARTCLIVGGARSGKSRYAQSLAEASGRSPIYIATAAAADDEMRDRIARHQAARDARWRTVEEPLALADVLSRDVAAGSVVLVDCLTLWLTNLVLGDKDIEAATMDLIQRLPTLEGAVIFVSNEVGSGIVPDNALARRFRDEQGRLNQALAQAVDAVVLVAAGLPLQLKPNTGPSLRV